MLFRLCIKKNNIFILTSFNRTPKNKKVKVKQSLISLVSEFLNSIHRPNEFLGKSTLHFTEPCFNYTYFDIMKLQKLCSISIKSCIGLWVNVKVMTSTAL